MSKNETSKKILKELKEKDVKMHSRYYFVILTLLTILSAVLLTTLSAILARLWLDDVDYIGKGELLRLGPGGRGAIASSFPWGLTLLTIASVFGTIKLFQKLEISYKNSLTIFYSGIGVAILLMIFTVSSLDAHKPFERFPGVDRLQTLKHKVDDKSVSGEVVDVNYEHITIRDINGKTIHLSTDGAYKGGEAILGGGVKAIGEWTSEDTYTVDAIYFHENMPMHKVKSYRMK